MVDKLFDDVFQTECKDKNVRTKGASQTFLEEVEEDDKRHYLRRIKFLLGE